MQLKSQQTFEEFFRSINGHIYKIPETVLWALNGFLCARVEWVLQNKDFYRINKIYTPTRGKNKKKKEAEIRSVNACVCLCVSDI